MTLHTLVSITYVKAAGAFQEEVDLPFPSQQGGASAQDSFMSSEPEVLISTEGDYTRDSSVVEHDEWEQF